MKIENIRTVNDLKKTFPRLVEKLEDEILEKLGTMETGDKKILTEGEKRKVRERAKRIAGM